MTQSTLKERIHQFSRWHYEIDLDGIKTPIFDRRFINRHLQRKRYFFDPMVQLLGGSLTGKRVLDLGCNAGFWSLQAIEHGCDYVLGVDGRRMHIDQAELVFEAKGVAQHRYHFLQSNVHDLEPAEIGTFDVVLCLGLLYHTSKPFSLMEIVSKTCQDLAIIDTAMSLQQGPVLEIIREPLDEPRSACDYELVMFPSRSAVIAMAEQLGMTTAVMAPSFRSYEGSEDYQRGERRAFLCSKGRPLNGLEIEEQTSSVPLTTPNTMNISTGSLARQLVGRFLQRLGYRNHQA